MIAGLFIEAGSSHNVGTNQLVSPHDANMSRCPIFGPLCQGIHATWFVMTANPVDAAQFG